MRVRHRSTGETGTVLGAAERASLVLVRWDQGYACAERREALEPVE